MLAARFKTLTFNSDVAHLIFYAKTQIFCRFNFSLGVAIHCK